jgi:Uncharacterized conserved protein, contains double-stranded beta-helix domain
MSRIEGGNWNNLPWKDVRPGITQIVFAMGADQLSCTIGEIQNGHEVKPHSHPNEQVALVLDGVCDYYVDGVPHRMSKGSWVVVPGGVEHYVHVYDSDVPCLQMDIFAPSRPEYTEGYTQFLAEQGIEIG